MEAVKAANKLEHHKQVVRNLSNKISDPGQEYMRRGWMSGGVGEVSGI